MTEDQWTQFWRRNSITTFARQFNQNYDREFVEFWNARFGTLRSGATIVDLGTGNGAICFLAHQYAVEHDRDYKIVGLDLADIHPREVLDKHADLLAAFATVEFRSRVAIEETALDAQSVDLLTSQYGFEYADTARSIKEAHRILAPGATIALVLHHEDSEVVKLASDGIAQAHYCLRKEELDKKVIVLLRAMGDVVTLEERRALQSNRKTERLRQKLNAAVARINTRAQRHQDPEGFIGVIVPNLLNVFMQYKDSKLDEKLRYVARVQAEFRAFEQRMADLRAAALSCEDFASLVQEFASSGFEIRETGELRYGANADLMGWTLIAEKRAN